MKRLKPSAVDNMSLLAMVRTRSLILVLVATSKICPEGKEEEKTPHLNSYSANANSLLPIASAIIFTILN